MSINRAIIVGRLGADPEYKKMSSGNAVAKFSIATSERWVDANGHKQEKVQWHQVIAWNQLADLCTKYLRKGREVFVEGRLETRSYEDKDNIKRYITEVILQRVNFLGRKDEQPEDQDDSQEELPLPEKKVA